MMDHPTHYTVGPLPTIDIFGIQLPTYYLVISITYCLCIFWFYRRAEQRQLSQKTAMDIALILMIAGFIGGRLAHILFEQPQYYIDNPAEIFAFWQGGFVFYGGALFGYLCAWLYARRNPKEFWQWHDVIAPVLALGYALGRVACFLVGCCYGRICELPWATPLKQVDIQSGATEILLRHPTQLYATGMELLILGFLLIREKRPYKTGQIFLMWVGLHAIARTVMELFRDDPRGPTLLSLSVSTVISLGLLTSVGFAWRSLYKET